MYWIDTSSNSSMRGVPAQISFYCDDQSDISNLPTSSTEGVQQGDDTTSCRKCAKGSQCLCLSSSEVYMLNSNDEWLSL